MLLRQQRYAGHTCSMLSRRAGENFGHALHCKIRRKAWLPSLRKENQTSKIAKDASCSGVNFPSMAEQEVWCWRADMKAGSKLAAIQP